MYIYMYIYRGGVFVGTELLWAVGFGPLQSRLPEGRGKGQYYYSYRTHLNGIICDILGYFFIAALHPNIYALDIEQ
jgi:hypothetical protein